MSFLFRFLYIFCISENLVSQYEQLAMDGNHHHHPSCRQTYAKRTHKLHHWLIQLRWTKSRVVFKFYFYEQIIIPQSSTDVCTVVQRMCSEWLWSYDRTLQSGWLSRGSQSRKVSMVSGAEGWAWGMSWAYESALPMVSNWLSADSMASLTISSSCSWTASATAWNESILALQSRASIGGPCRHRPQDH